MIDFRKNEGLFKEEVMVIVYDWFRSNIKCVVNV